MTLKLTPTTSTGVHTISPPRITVIGVGGGGGNAVDNMISTELSAVEFIVANTDAQQLNNSKAAIRLQLGPQLTRGLGAGAKPDIGRQSAEEISDEIGKHLEGTDLVFITAGMGGGTGTGAAPVIARISREKGALTIGVVSKPFHFEGKRRERAAEAGIAELQKHVDTLIVIPNQNLFSCATQTTSLIDAFRMADGVLHRGVRSITDLMVIPGRINLDFADVKTVMDGKGKAMIGTGYASAEEDGADWAILAAERAIDNPLLEETSVKGASGLLVNITGGSDLLLHDYTQIMERIGDEADPDAEIISGLLTRDDMEGRVEISVVATGLTTRRNAEHDDSTENSESEFSPPPQPEHESTPTQAQTSEEQGETPQQTRNSGIPNYHLDVSPHMPQQAASSLSPQSPQTQAGTASTPQQGNMGNYGQRNITPGTPRPGSFHTQPDRAQARQAPQEERGGGLFSRFFRSRPATPEQSSATQQRGQQYGRPQTSQQGQPRSPSPSSAQHQTSGQPGQSVPEKRPEQAYPGNTAQNPDPQLEIPAYLRQK